MCGTCSCVPQCYAQSIRKVFFFTWTNQRTNFSTSYTKWVVFMWACVCIAYAEVCVCLCVRVDCGVEWVSLQNILSLIISLRAQNELSAPDVAVDHRAFSTQHNTGLAIANLRFETNAAYHIMLFRMLSDVFGLEIYSKSSTEKQLSSKSNPVFQEIIWGEANNKQRTTGETSDCFQGKRTHCKDMRKSVHIVSLQYQLWWYQLFLVSFSMVNFSILLMQRPNNKIFVSLCLQHAPCWIVRFFLRNDLHFIQSNDLYALNSRKQNRIHRYHLVRSELAHSIFFVAGCIVTVWSSLNCEHSVYYGIASW